MCGVVGVIGPESNQGRDARAANEAYRALLSLQHRGQDAAGILAYDGQTKMFSCEKDLGLVAQVFNQEKIARLTGYMAIGHNRYATVGSNGAADVQPMVTGIPFGLGMAHNGNILNYFPLARTLTQEFKRQLLTNNDLEVLIHYFGHFLVERSGGYPDADTFKFENIKRAASRIFDTAIGGYAVVSLIADEGMVAFRDPKGIRPLVMGVQDRGSAGKSYCFSSETISLTYLGYDYWRDVAPGEVVFVSKTGVVESAVVRKEEKTAPCMFEWVYFSAAESVQQKRAVYTVRLNLGVRLGSRARAAIERGEISPDVVMPVPDTSRSAAISVAHELNLPYREGLIKNRYVHRSFILNSQEQRDAALEIKLSPIRSEIEGKRILLIDDSIVRGTTARRIVALLGKYGAREVTLGITCPPHRHGCYYGIDFPDNSALIASGRTEEEIAQWLGVNKIIYLDEEDLREAIGIPDLCMACINNKYPTEISEARRFASERMRVQIAERER